MSIQQALANASRDVLSSYLASDLVEQLTEDIVQRAAVDIEAALVALAGFDLPRSSGPRAKQTAAGTPRRAATRSPRRRRDAAEGSHDDDSSSGMDHDASGVVTGHDDAGAGSSQDDTGTEVGRGAGQNGRAAAESAEVDDVHAAAMT